MYTDFFNLKVKPFELVPNPMFLYLSRSHKKALNFLRYGLNEQAGFILLTGEVGSGKTTIVRSLVSELGSDVVLSMLFNTKVSNKQVLAMINEDFGLNVIRKDKVTMLRNLNDFLIGIHAQKRRAVVIIDEAQDLSASALEEIRLLSNLESTNAKLLQIVLVGQPELNKTIASHELRQLRQRISVHSHIDPLTRFETEGYVYYRLEKAGNRSALTWCEGTFDLLFEHSHGIPRLINIVCDYILLAACSEGTKEVSKELVQDVISDVSWDKHFAEHTADNSAALDTSPLVQDLIDEVPLDKHVTEHTADDQVELNSSPQQNLVERLSVYEQKMEELEARLSHHDEIIQELKLQNELLNKILDIQEKGFHRMEAGLERTCHHLQMYLTGSVANEESELKNAENDENGNQTRKGLLGKLFS